MRMSLCALIATCSALRVPPIMRADSTNQKRLLVIGGNGFVGRHVCRYAVQKGFKVTSMSRRGECPIPDDKWLSQVEWKSGNALDKKTVVRFVQDADAVVDSGLVNLNAFTSFSKSKADADSTYDNVIRKSAILLIEALDERAKSPSFVFKRTAPTPMVFMSAAEAGWPDVTFGPTVNQLAPDWLKRYLDAKRAVEAELARRTATIRAVIIRPSFIWNFAKLDVLPLVPVFNIGNAIGLPFVDKTVRVEDVGKAIVAGLLDEQVKGVQRYMQIENLSASLQAVE